MNKKRDDFKQSVINKLAKRVSYRCSNPECRAQTIAGSYSTDDVVSIGVAAHISAAASGGPRFDPNIDSQQRASYSNGIWLCQNCSRKIDVDFKSYSTETLKKWKHDAEASAIKSLGNKTYTDEEYRKEIKSQISNIAIPKKSLTEAFLYEKKRIEDKDNRFCVEVSADSSGSISYLLSPKEKVNFGLKVFNNESFNIEDFKNFFDYGGEVEIPSGNFSITGSEIFSDIGKKHGKLKITQEPKKSEIKLMLLSDEGEDCEFQTFDAEIFTGKLGSNIKCKSKSRFIEMDLLYKNNESLKFNLRFEFSLLIGKGVYHIPYLARYLKLKKFIFNSKIVEAKIFLVMDGVDYEVAWAKDDELINYLYDFAYVINFIEMVVTYSKLTNKELIINDFKIENDSYKSLKDYLNYSSVENFDFSPDEEFSKSIIKLNEDALKDFEITGVDSYSYFGNIRFSKHDSFILFGNLINAPEYSIYYDSVNCVLNKLSQGEYLMSIIATEDTKISSIRSTN